MSHVIIWGNAMSQQIMKYAIATLIRLLVKNIVPAKSIV